MTTNPTLIPEPTSPTAVVVSYTQPQPRSGVE